MLNSYIQRLIILGKKNEQDQIEEIKLTIDGQCDLPRYNAPIQQSMDTHTNKVLCFNIVHIKEVTSSNAMKKEGFIRCIDEIENHQLSIQTVSTDRHASVKKPMQTKTYAHISHQFDPWHIAKGILKKSDEESQKERL